MKLRDLADQLQCRLEGGAASNPGDIEIHRVSGIEHAQPGDLTFLDNPRYGSFLGTTRASAVIVSAAQAIPEAPRSACCAAARRTSRSRGPWRCSRRRRRRSRASIR